MTNVTPINKAPRLTEQEVHQAAQNLIDSGEVVSSLTLLRALGRGSLTTITKYMSTFNQGNEDSQHPELSSFTEIPETLSRSTKLLAIKIWTESQQIANKELENRREVLQKAAQLSAERVKEAEAFSDEQTKRLEEIEQGYGQEIEELRNSLNISNTELKEKTERLNRTIIELEIAKNENDSLKITVQETKNQLSELKTTKEVDLTELKQDNQSRVEELKMELKDQVNALYRFKESSSEIQNKLDTENKRLDLQVAKQQMSLDMMSKRLEEEKYLRSADEKENKVLREKSSLLEGELNAWKKMNPVADSSSDK